LSNCKYCGLPAGFLHSKHTDCERRYADAKVQIVKIISEAVLSSAALQPVEQRVNELAQTSFVSDAERHGLLLEGWGRAVDRCLEDDVLDESEEKRLIELRDHFALSQADLQTTEAYSRVVKAAVIRDILRGNLPQRMTIDGNVPINFQKGEQFVWAFPHTDYLEDRTRRQYVGGSQGVSVRVMKGVYYRVGAFKGEAVDRNVRIHVDSGLFAVTNKNVYFVGPVKSLRIAYAKVLTFQSFSNGVGIVRDSANAKPQIFVTGDGWFTYNLVMNLAHF